MNADGYPEGCKTARDPSMSPHDTHGDPGKESKTNGKAEPGQKKERNKNQDEHHRTLFCSGFKKDLRGALSSEETQEEKEARKRSAQYLTRLARIQVLDRIRSNKKVLRRKRQQQSPASIRHILLIRSASCMTIHLGKKHPPPREAEM